ncbi:MAG: mannose-1-phosphate guanylyltransferase/mannose-6-phosphate isomerase [Thiohalomonadales bacterium]|nr:mannose-1-phosphate guanylyltransferase/mannose-6-phosphate isomerase [Thiohalomonadales bacterium]
MTTILQPVILSGGSGSRLWPMSRALYPKQLLPLVSEQTLLQDTVTRLDGIEAHARDLKLADPLVVCNEAHRFFVAEQLLELNKSASDIILEPVGRNTAPALTLAALSIAAQDPQTVMLVMPADHVITDIPAFHAALIKGASLAVQNYLVTFGITPDIPETGYGYIHMGEPLVDEATKIAAFVEKPDPALAEKYLASGEYLWNSGMFMMTAENWLKAIRGLQPEMAECVDMAWQKGERDRDFFRIGKDSFANCPADSIDYAVMEKITAKSIDDLDAAVIPLAAGWSDVGAWSSLWEVGNKDAAGNVTRGDVFTHDAENCLIYGDSRHIAGIGLKDMVIVETADAVLVANKDRAQEVKQAVEWLKEAEREEHLIHRRVYRPWGNFESIDNGDRYQVKRLTIKPGASISLQLHHHRAEHWIVVKGTAHVTRGEDVFLVTENESTFIPLGVKHRLENRGSIPLEIIEVQSGSYLGEDDIVRFDDVYGRKDNKA